MPLGVVIVTLTAPAACAGVLVMIEVLLTTENGVAAVLPKVTAVAPRRFVPVMVTAVPPDAGPEAGVMLVNAGGAVLNIAFIVLFAWTFVKV